MQLGGSLMVTFTVPIPVLMFLEPPLELTMIPAIGKIATTARKSAPARGFRAIQSDFMVLLLLKKNFSEHLFAGRGQLYRPDSRPWLGCWDLKSWALLTARIIALTDLFRCLRGPNSGQPLRQGYAGLRSNFNGRANVDERIDFVYFLVGQRDATVRPIGEAVLRAKPSPFRSQPMNFHIAAGADAQFSGIRAVGRIWVGKVQCFVKLTVRILGVHGINTLGSFVISLAILRANGLPAKGDFVGLHSFPAVQQGKRSLALFDHNSINFRSRLRAKFGNNSNTHRRGRKNTREAEDFSSVLRRVGHRLAGRRPLCMSPELRTADEPARDEDKHAANDNLKRTLEKRSVHVTVANEADDAEFEHNHPHPHANGH